MAAPYSTPGEHTEPASPQAPAAQPAYSAPRQAAAPAPAKNKLPGWVIAVIIVAIIAVIFAVLLGGILIGRSSAPVTAAATPAPFIPEETALPVADPEPAEEKTDIPPSEPGPAAEPEPAVEPETAPAAEPKVQARASESPVSDILYDIESRPGFDDTVFAPLCSYSDIDDDDVNEFLAVYVDNSDNSVTFEFWSVPNGGRLSPSREDCRVLFTMVGGNSGTAGLAVHDGQLYLALYRNTPDGESFNEVRNYVPIHAGGLFWDDVISLEGRGRYDDEHNGYYYLDGKEITREDYDAFIGDYLCPITQNILVGPGNGDVATFEVMHTWFG